MQKTTPSQSVAQNEQARRSKYRIAAMVFCLLLFIMGIIFLIPNDESTTQNGIVQKMNKDLKQLSAQPFAEMTIPYLRAKTYKSTLGVLEEAYDGGNYTAYVTSYQSDGLKINGLLTKPKGDMPDGGWPTIVFVHGYIPPTTYTTQGQAYAAYVDYLASQGFVVFKIDLRGHGDSEGEPGGAYYSSDYIVDTLNAYAALQTSEFVHPQKIGLWGHSMAGNVTMRSVAVKPEIPAVVIWAGAVYTYEDMLKYRISDSSYQPPGMSTQRQRRRQEMYEKHGSPSAKSAFWRQVMPVSYLGDVKGSIQVHHAVDDEVVNVGYSRDLKTFLDKASVRYEYYEYQSGGHNISGESFTTAMERTVTFFKKYL